MTNENYKPYGVITAQPILVSTNPNTGQLISRTEETPIKLSIRENDFGNEVYMYDNNTKIHLPSGYTRAIISYHIMYNHNSNSSNQKDKVSLLAYDKTGANLLSTLIHTLVAPGTAQGELTGGEGTWIGNVSDFGYIGLSMLLAYSTTDGNILPYYLNRMGIFIMLFK